MVAGSGDLQWLMRKQPKAKLIIESSTRHAVGFDTDKPTMCRQMAVHICVWAIGQLLDDVARLLAAPGGTMAADVECEFLSASVIHRITPGGCLTPAIATPAPL